MATTLVLNNANFTTNKLDTVVFADTPCTGISLSANTVSLTSMGATQTLTATLTPADTTDVLRWTSSDSTVATVVGGVVTAVGLGSATITATCGNYSATCAVTVAVTYSPTWIYGKQLYGASADTGKYISLLSQTSSASGVSTTAPVSGAADIYDGTVSDHHSGYYTYPIPGNTTSIRVVATGCYIGLHFSDSTDIQYSDFASWTGGNDASSSAGVSGDYTYTVPENVDSFSLTVRLTSGSSMTESALTNVGVQVLFLTE